MTRRRVVFVDKFGYRYVTPEYNGDKTERDFFGIGGCSKTWAEINEIFDKVKTYPDFVKANVEAIQAYSNMPATPAFRLRKNQEMYEADELLYIYEKDKEDKPIVPVSCLPNERKAAMLDGFIEQIKGLDEYKRQQIFKMLGLTDDEVAIYNFTRPKEGSSDSLKPEDFNCELLPVCEFKSSSVPVFKIKTPVGCLYIQSEASDDNKIQIYDSQQKYMLYIEADTMTEAAESESTTVTEEILKFAYRLSTANDINQLVYMLFGAALYDWGLITKDWHEAAKEVQVPTKKALLQDEWVNVVGDYYIVVS